MHTTWNATGSFAHVVVLFWGLCCVALPDDGAVVDEKTTFVTVSACKSVDVNNCDAGVERPIEGNRLLTVASHVRQRLGAFVEEDARTGTPPLSKIGDIGKASNASVFGLQPARSVAPPLLDVHLGAGNFARNNTTMLTNVHPEGSPHTDGRQGKLSRRDWQDSIIHIRDLALISLEAGQSRQVTSLFLFVLLGVMFLATLFITFAVMPDDKCEDDMSAKATVGRSYIRERPSANASRPLAPVATVDSLLSPSIKSIGAPSSQFNPTTRWSAASPTINSISGTPSPRLDAIATSPNVSPNVTASIVPVHMENTPSFTLCPELLVPAGVECTLMLPPPVGPDERALGAMSGDSVQFGIANLSEQVVFNVALVSFPPARQAFQLYASEITEGSPPVVFATCCEDGANKMTISPGSQVDGQAFGELRLVNSSVDEYCIVLTEGRTLYFKARDHDASVPKLVDDMGRLLATTLPVPRAQSPVHASRRMVTIAPMTDVSIVILGILGMDWLRQKAASGPWR